MVQLYALLHKAIHFFASYPIKVNIFDDFDKSLQLNLNYSRLTYLNTKEPDS